MPLHPNEHFEEYLIRRVLGEGGFGRVYLAEDTLLRRQVAIKELSRAPGIDSDAVERFMAEARAAGGLAHPHIVIVHALRIAGPAVYIVMEYLSRGSLREYIDECKQLAIPEAAALSGMVAQGLAVAHAAGIVHRDIKPENILLTADLRAKIADFGVAHVPRDGAREIVGVAQAPPYGSCQEPAGLTLTGSQPGTLLYMSPEQVCGQRVDGKSDVYQLGAVLYEMLTGRHYLDLDALAQRARKLTGANATLYQTRLYDLIASHICGDPIPDVRLQRSDVLPALAEVVKMAMQQESARRPTAEQLAARLAEIKDVLTSGSKRAMPAASSPYGVPREEEDYLGRGLALLEQNRPDEAIAALQAALQADSFCVEARRGLALIYGVHGRIDEAIQQYREVVALTPGDPSVLYNLGLAYARQGHVDEAIAQFRAALAINPDDAGVTYDLGVALADQGELDEAVATLQRVIDLDPRLADAYHRLGAIYADQNRSELAIAALEKAVRLDFSLKGAHVGLGWQYIQVGRWREAAYEYETVLRSSPDDAYAH